MLNIDCRVPDLARGGRRAACVSYDVGGMLCMYRLLFTVFARLHVPGSRYLACFKNSHYTYDVQGGSSKITQIYSPTNAARNI